MTDDEYRAAHGISFYDQKQMRMGHSESLGGSRMTRQLHLVLRSRVGEGAAWATY